MTLPDDTYTATIDRIEEGIAVLLIEAAGSGDNRGDDTTVDNDNRDDVDTGAPKRKIVDEVHCSADAVPQRAREELGVVIVTLVDGEVVEIEHQSQATQQRRAELQDRFDQLAERPPDSDEEC